MKQTNDNYRQFIKKKLFDDEHFHVFNLINFSVSLYILCTYSIIQPNLIKT